MQILYIIFILYLVLKYTISSQVNSYKYTLHKNFDKIDKNEILNICQNIDSLHFYNVAALFHTHFVF